MLNKLQTLLLVLVIIMSTSVVFAKTKQPKKAKQLSKEEMLQLHQQMGIDYFNQSWDLLEKPNRTKDEDDNLINMVHASLFHWSQSQQPINTLRGEWMVAHVYTLLEHREEAIYHAKNVLYWATKAKAQDWDLAYAYEAMARANALNGDKEEFHKYNDMAMEAGNEIKAEDDRRQFEEDFNGGNWFGFK